MRKILLICSLFWAIISYAQGTRIMYEYKFVSNLDKEDSADTELMYLDIRKDGSKFYSRQRFVSDSIRNEYIHKTLSSGSQNFSFSQIVKSKIDYSVSKTYPDFEVHLHTRLGQNRFDVIDTKPMEWKISPEKKMIDKFDTQKATLEFGGRTWTAWFTQDIPFIDGPYKFHGLPGLILEMEDSTGTHIFKFAGIEKFDDVEKIEKNKPEITGRGAMIFGNMPGREELKVTEDQFIKQWKEYKNNPVKDMRQTLSSMPSDARIKVNMNGKEMADPAEILRNMEKHFKEEIKQDNNKIEPALYP